MNNLEKFAAAKAPLQADVANAKGELDAAINHLASMPESLERRKAVATAKSKLIEATSALECLEAAETEVHRRAREADRAARAVRRQEERGQIREMNTAIDDAAVAIIKHIQQLGPLLVAYDKLARDRELLCMGLAREAESHLPIPRQHSTEQLLRQADPSRGPLAGAILAAFESAGLSRVGPRLVLCGEHVEFNAGSVEYRADPISAYLNDAKDLQRNVRDALDRADQTLADRDARAA